MTKSILLPIPDFDQQAALEINLAGAKADHLADAELCAVERRRGQ